MGSCSVPTEDGAAGGLLQARHDRESWRLPTPREPRMPTISAVMQPGRTMSRTSADRRARHVVVPKDSPTFLSVTGVRLIS